MYMSYHDSAQQYSTVQWYSHHTLKLIQCVAYSKMEKKSSNITLKFNRYKMPYI